MQKNNIIIVLKYISSPWKYEKSMYNLYSTHLLTYFTQLSDDGTLNYTTLGHNLAVTPLN